MRKVDGRVPDLQNGLTRVRVVAQRLVGSRDLVHAQVVAKPVPVGPIKLGPAPNILGKPSVPRLQECQVVAARHDPDDLRNSEGDVKGRLAGSDPSLPGVVDGDGGMEDFLGCSAPARLHKNAIACPERLRKLLPNMVCTGSLKRPKHQRLRAEV